MATSWLSGNNIIDRVNAVIKRDGTAACPYDGRAHLFTGPREEIHEDGLNILNYDHDVNGNYANAKFLAPIFGAILIEDTNIYREVLGNVDGTGLDVYKYLIKSYDLDGIEEKYAVAEADRVMRHGSLYFVDGLYGSVTTSACGGGRDRILFDTEFMRMGQEAYDLVTGLAKSKDIEFVNEDSILNIRKLFKHNAIEMAYRLLCVNEIELLRRTAWNLEAEKIMRICLDCEEFYAVDRQQMWRVAAKEIFKGHAALGDLVALDKKLNRTDRAARRSPRFCGSPHERLLEKERNLYAFVFAVMSKRAMPVASP